MHMSHALLSPLFQFLLTNTNVETNMMLSYAARGNICTGRSNKKEENHLDTRKYT